MKFKILAVLLLLVWGVIKLPWENSLDAEQRKLTLGSAAPITLKMRDQLGQGLTLAALGGFRGLAAIAVWLMMYSDWEKGDWPWVRTYAELGVLLQPRDVYFWDNGSWMLAYNASIDIQNEGKNMTPAERRAESRKLVDLGLDMLKRGIQFNPNKYVLYQRMGDLYQQRLGDLKAAARCYEEASEKPGAPPYLRRFPGYMLLRAGDDQGAFDYWKKIWPTLTPQERGSLQWGRVRDEIKKLEEKLNIPRQERILAS